MHMPCKFEAEDAWICMIGANRSAFAHETCMAVQIAATIESHDMILDRFDRQILDALQRDGSLTNGSLSEIVNLSPSQCSRRRAALEAAGLIGGYHARLDARKLGFHIRAIVRVNLRTHGQDTDTGFSRWAERQAEVQSAFTVSGDADYVLDIRVRDLESYSNFVHEKLLIQPQVAQVRSDFVLRTLKDSDVLDLSETAAGG